MRVQAFVLMAASSAARVITGAELGTLANREVHVFTDLASQLSYDAALILPDNPLMSDHERWQEYSRPTYSAVVEVANEGDVSTVIRFANNRSFPFLAVNGGHGHTTTLAKMQNGIAISLRRMKSIQISTTGDYADLQPGLTSGEVMRDLWTHDKTTVTGGCLCTGIMGVVLGGGHGFLQGLLGRAADQILEARVVLANGTAVVASPTSNEDLFWGLRGAGHNFGIVTSVKHKIYDSIPTWSMVNLVFTEDKLEQVFDLANSFISQEDHPAELILWHTFLRRPDIDPVNSVVSMLFIHPGPPSLLAPFADPFNALSPAWNHTYDSFAYPELFSLMRVDESSTFACAKGMYRHMMGVYVPEYNSTSLRTVFDLFNGIVKKYPDIAPTAVYFVEGYSQQATTRVADRDTAIPWRGTPLLVSPIWGYTNASYSPDIVAASKAMRKAMVDGSGLPQRTYVNYAFGDEKLEEVYGEEPWRLERLRALKEKWDPQGRFGFYAPIRPEEKGGNGRWRQSWGAYGS
ncbi:FAD-binding domain-containing protein [Podospora aff. communis PSN243]|uniref:FAD-binding domain-containing protein n=1 Tax=Podospora aff. communis PSN243 TaxID=3040156 RepID=A0AAV9G3M8_9PEZI|nr:FAD-binding domain-containing protein [Podospora aff. communis PSN243]